MFMLWHANPTDYDENILNGGDKNYGQSGYTGKLTENNLLILHYKTPHVKWHFML